MKNVQYYLKKFDKKEIAKAYFDKYLADRVYDSLRYDKDGKNMTFDQYYKQSIKKLISFINRLCKLEPVELSEDEQCVFIRHEAIDYHNHNLSMNFDCCVYKLKDVYSKKKNIEGYVYTFNHQDEILSYYIADTYYNKKHIIDELVDILWEASFVGYDEDHDKNADKKIKRINESKKDLDNDKKSNWHSWDEVRMELFGYTKKQIKEENKYEKRKRQSGITDIENRYLIAYDKYDKESLMFQVNEIRNNNLFLEDSI